jgi:hypothetical protein
MRLKALTFRSYVVVLNRDGRRGAIMALVPPDTAALIADPPLAGSWMDLKPMMHLTQAVEKLGGMTAVRELARKGTDEARKPYMGVVEGVLKLFGVSPATLFKRMNALVSSFIEGIDYRYTPISDRSGAMEMEWDADFEIPMCVMIGQTPTFQVLLDACGVKGVVGQPERLGPKKARFLLHW